MKILNSKNGYSLLIGAATGFTGDSFSVNRALLVVLLVTVLVHVIPTLALPFFSFDKEKEQEQRVVYTYSGPLGMGLFIGALLRYSLLPSSAPDGITFTAIALPILTAVVYLSYWGSRVQSRDKKTEVARRNSGMHKEPIMRMLDTVDYHGYHERAEAGMDAVMNGQVRSLMGPGRWFETTKKLLVKLGVNPSIFDDAEALLGQMADDENAREQVTM